MHQKFSIKGLWLRPKEAISGSPFRFLRNWLSGRWCCENSKSCGLQQRKSVYWYLYRKRRIDLRQTLGANSNSERYLLQLQDREGETMHMSWPKHSVLKPKPYHLPPFPCCLQVISDLSLHIFTEKSFSNVWFWWNRHHSVHCKSSCKNEDALNFDR